MNEEQLQQRAIAILKHHSASAGQFKTSTWFMEVLKEVKRDFEAGMPVNNITKRVLSAIIAGTALAMGYADVVEHSEDYMAAILAVYILID
jgi:hypothetical protein